MKSNEIGCWKLNFSHTARPNKKKMLNLIWFICSARFEVVVEMKGGTLIPTRTGIHHSGMRTPEWGWMSRAGYTARLCMMRLFELPLQSNWHHIDVPDWRGQTVGQENDSSPAGRGVTAMPSAPPAPPPSLGSASSWGAEVAGNDRPFGSKCQPEYFTLFIAARPNEIFTNAQNIFIWNLGSE